MIRSPTRSHVLILPLVILLVVLLEQIAEREVRRQIENLYLRTAVIMALYAVGFSFAFQQLSPWLKKLLIALRARSRKQGGAVGIWIFFALAYSLLFYGYFKLETEGAASLLPAAWR